MKNKKRIMMMAGSIFVVVNVAVVVYILVRQDSKDPAFSPDLDENAIVQTDGIKEKPEGIRIPGYPRITISADTKDVTMNLQNPEGNPCYFTFEIILTEGEETIYTSKLVEPGKAITDVTLSRALEKGEYPAVIKITTTSLTDGSAMNGQMWKPFSLHNKRGKKMKKKLLILTALLTFAISAMTVSAKAPGKTNVTYQVDPSYEVVIPSDATVPFLTEKSAYGTIEIKEAVLEENKCILVKMDASGTLVNEKHPKSKIPYQILNGKKEFKSQKYTKAGEKTDLTISIKKADWNKARGGSYKTAVTFTI